MTPLALEILVHHYITPEPFSRKSSGIEAIHDDFEKAGVFVVDDKHPGGYNVTPLGQSWLKAMLRVPIPKLAYVDANDNVVCRVEE